jgi:hypothetical protein
MTVFGGGSAASRRTFVAGLLAAALVVGVNVHAQQAAPAAPADPFKFTSDSGYFQFVVKPDKTAQFEAVWDAIFAKLGASDKPELKEVASSLHMYKLEGAAGATGVTYLFMADPASKTSSYSISPFLLFESGMFPRGKADEAGTADQMFAQVSDAVSGFGAQPLHKMH